nr:transcriptional regulator [Rickettsia endosymbiont of Ceutorhynchus assimilis]
MNISLTPELEKYKMWLNQEVQIGIDQAAQGKLISGEKALENLKNFRNE